MRRNICTTGNTCFFLSFPLHFTSQPASLYSWICNDEGQKEEQMERKTKFSLPFSIVIIITTDPAGSGSWYLVQGSRGSGVSITHNSWLVVRRTTTTQLHFPFMAPKDSRLKTLCVCVCVCISTLTWSIVCIVRHCCQQRRSLSYIQHTSSFH